MTQQLAFREACARADLARAQMKISAAQAKARIAPALLIQDAKDKAIDSVSGAADHGTFPTLIRSFQEHPNRYAGE